MPGAEQKIEIARRIATDDRGIDGYNPVQFIDNPVRTVSNLQVVKTRAWRAPRPLRLQILDFAEQNRLRGVNPEDEALWHLCRQIPGLFERRDIILSALIRERLHSLADHL